MKWTSLDYIFTNTFLMGAIDYRQKSISVLKSDSGGSWPKKAGNTMIRIEELSQERASTRREEETWAWSCTKLDNSGVVTPGGQLQRKFLISNKASPALSGFLLTYLGQPMTVLLGFKLVDDCFKLSYKTLCHIQMKIEMKHWIISEANTISPDSLHIC